MLIYYIINLLSTYIIFYSSKLNISIPSFMKYTSTFCISYLNYIFSNHQDSIAFITDFFSTVNESSFFENNLTDFIPSIVIYEKEDNIISLSEMLSIDINTLLIDNISNIYYVILTDVHGDIIKCTDFLLKFLSSSFSQYSLLLLLTESKPLIKQLVLNLYDNDYLSISLSFLKFLSYIYTQPTDPICSYSQYSQKSADFSNNMRIFVYFWCNFRLNTTFYIFITI